MPTLVQDHRHADVDRLHEGVRPGRHDGVAVDIARKINPLLQGWMNYYGRYVPSALYPMLHYVDRTLRAWAMRKFKRLKRHKVRAGRFLQGVARKNAALFVHWRHGMIGTFA